MNLAEDLWWVNKGRTSYTCPLLMTLSMWWLRLQGKIVDWGDRDRIVLDNGKTKVAIQCIFPKWLILVECYIHNWFFRKRLSK